MAKAKKQIEIISGLQLRNFLKQSGFDARGDNRTSKYDKQAEYWGYFRKGYGEALRALRALGFKVKKETKRESRRFDERRDGCFVTRIYCTKGKLELQIVLEGRVKYGVVTGPKKAVHNPISEYY